LISGKPYSGNREIKTPHGTYCPIFVDFTQKDGFKRLKEIKSAIDRTSFLIDNVFYSLMHERWGLSIRRQCHP